VARTTKPRRRSYTPEQRAERARLDGELRDRAARTIAGDGAAVGDFIREAVGGMSPRILGYSLNNQVLLMEQAEERGIPLRDVDTLKGWRTRGRAVRKGETGLRINRPLGAGDDEAKGNQDEAPTVRQLVDDRDGGQPVRFAMMSVFEVSQTDVVAAEEGCQDCGAEAKQRCTPLCACEACAFDGFALDDGDAADLLWNNLFEQVVRAGYAFDWPADVDTLAGNRVRVDHDAQAVRVAMSVTAEDTEALAEIAAALAQILARAAQDKADRRAEIPQQRQAELPATR
jgi:hypothetical protein